MRKLLTVFPDGGDLIGLRHSLDTFLVMNASNLHQFQLSIHLKSPDPDTKDLVKRLYSHRGVTIITGKSSPCMPCIMKRFRTRYAVIIPPRYRSISPLWPYLDEIATVLQSYPRLTHIRLLPDTDTKNLIHNTPLVYHYATPHLLIGNGNLRRDLPILMKSSLRQTQTTVAGMLKPQIFRQHIA